MKYRKLGNTGLDISVIGIGTDQFSGSWGKKFGQEEVNKIMDRASELGVNFLDTAECYGDHLSEAMIGNAISKKRHEWIIATKFGHSYKKNNTKASSDFSLKGITNQFNNSLKALKTDYIDIYQFHSGNNSEFDQHEIWDFLNEQVKDDKIKNLGISVLNSAIDNDDLYQIESASKVGVKIIQIVYNRLNKNAEKKAIPFCLEHNLGIIGRVPLARGHLSGKYEPNHKFPENDKRYFEGKNQTITQLKMVQDIKKNEVPDGIEMAQWSLAWCLKNPAITTVIPGCKNIEQIESNVKATELI